MTSLSSWKAYALISVRKLFRVRIFVRICRKWCGRLGTCRGTLSGRFVNCACYFGLADQILHWIYDFMVIVLQKYYSKKK